MKTEKLNILIKILVIIGLNSIGILKVNAISNPYSPNGPYGVNCTWYTWKQASERAGVILPAWGNANTWYTSAKQAGYSVGQEPRNNSVIVWNMTSYGHVGYVEKVIGNDIYVWDSDSNCINEEDPEFTTCIDNSVDESTARACRENAKPAACKYDANQYSVIGYIYLDEASKVPSNNKESSNTTNIVSKPVEKSDNNYLKSITLSTGSIDFNKDTLEYNIEVNNEIESININAELEDAKATLKGTGDYELAVGTNDIKLEVVSENNTTREYTLHITRKNIEKEGQVKIVSTTKNISKQKTKLNMYLTCTFTLAMLLIMTATIIKIKNKGKIK